MGEASVRVGRMCSLVTLFSISLGLLDTHHIVEVWNRDCSGERILFLDLLRLMVS